MADNLFLRQIHLSPNNPPAGYLAEIPAVLFLASGHPLSFSRPVTFLVGENGSGKSTLLEAIAVALGFNPEGGSIHFSFSTHDTHSSLGQLLKITRGPYRPKDGFFLRAESFYNTAAYLDDLEREFSGALRSYGGKSLHAQSHGESFLSLVTNRFGGHGIYLLDEPEAALSPSRQLTLLAEIHRLAQDSQLIIATHSPILMAYPDAQILQFDGDGIHEIEYHETEHYQITKAFLQNPERMLRILFAEE